MPPGTRRFTGEFVVQDKTNGKQYLADLRWSWNLGNDLTGWVLGGNTIPTIAADGRISFYDATPAGGGSTGYFTIPNSLGRYNSILYIEAQRMIDDTSTNSTGFEPNIASGPIGGSGAIMAVSFPNWTLGFRNNLYQGSSFNGPIPRPTAGQSYSFALIISPSDIIGLIDKALVGTIPVGKIGNAPLSNTPLSYHNSVNKVIFFRAYGNAGQIVHVRVSKILFGALVGQGAL